MPVGEAPPDTRYFTVEETNALLREFASKHSDVAKVVDLTELAGAQKTHEGRSILALKISSNPAVDQDKPAKLLVAQHHARELNTPPMIFGAIERILEGRSSDPKLAELVNEHELYFVPMVNPDGVNQVWSGDPLWRKNRGPEPGGRGVDLNRNYPALYGQCGSSTNRRSQTYRGPAAASEPETRTMIALGKALRPEVYLDFH
ncbi:MAG: M14 family zinc carboxypeptidase, partial [Myxococcota bacterium]